jgi:hypothetical protein
VYPTKQQTGTELFQLVHEASQNFRRVALYFEKSLLPPDWKLLPSASAAVRRIEAVGAKVVVDSAAGVGLPWKGPALVDGQPWPVFNGDTVWLPPGAHSVEPARRKSGVHLVKLNAELSSARTVSAARIEFSYESGGRAIGVLSRPPKRVRIDGISRAPELASPVTVFLPRGRHAVTIDSE